jgi:hypothetical protein
MSRILTVTSPLWSLDARALVRPARTFQGLAATQNAPNIRSTFWTAARRPLFLTLVLGCVISLLGASVATIRLIGGAATYWSYVPLIEILALAIVLRRRSGRGLASLIDMFFAGHAAWTLFILIAGVVIQVTSPMDWWFIIIGPAVVGLVMVTGWSAYVDVCFFRYVCGSSRRRAVTEVVLHRFIAWTLIFWIFAVPEPTPLGVFQEIAEALKEVLR